MATENSKKQKHKLFMYVIISYSFYFVLLCFSAHSKTAITSILQSEFQLEVRHCIIFKIPSQF